MQNVSNNATENNEWLLILKQRESRLWELIKDLSSFNNEPIEVSACKVGYSIEDGNLVSLSIPTVETLKRFGVL